MPLLRLSCKQLGEASTAVCHLLLSHQLLPPAALGRDGLLPFVRNVSAARVASMQRYIEREVRPAVLFDYQGRAPDAFSAFITELLHLSRTKLNKLDQAPARG